LPSGRSRGKASAPRPDAGILLACNLNEVHLFTMRGLGDQRRPGPATEGRVIGVRDKAEAKEDAVAGGAERAAWER
jgi:hypothetical protein